MIPIFFLEAGAEIILIGITTFQADLLQTHSSRSQVTGGCGNSLRCDKVTETDSLIFFRKEHLNKQGLHWQRQQYH